MVDSIRPTYRAVPTRRNTLSQEVESHGDERYSRNSDLKKQERRKRKDRRNGRGNRLVYDMRHTQGRRKDDRGHPTVEVEV